MARSGGGTLPTYEIHSFAVRLGGTDPETLAGVALLGTARDWPCARGKVMAGRADAPAGDEEAVIGALRDAHG